MSRDLYIRVACGLLACTCWFAAGAYAYWTGKVDGLQTSIAHLEAEFYAARQDRQGIHEEISRCCYHK